MIQEDEVGVVWKIDSNVMKYLGDGSLKLELIITEPNSSLLRYEGNVTPKISCGCK